MPTDGRSLPDAPPAPRRQEGAWTSGSLRITNWIGTRCVDGHTGLAQGAARSGLCSARVAGALTNAEFGCRTRSLARAPFLPRLRRTQRNGWRAYPTTSRPMAASRASLFRLAPYRPAAPRDAAMPNQARPVRTRSQLTKGFIMYAGAVATCSNRSSRELTLPSTFSLAPRTICVDHTPGLTRSAHRS